MSTDLSFGTVLIQSSRYSVGYRYIIDKYIKMEKFSFKDNLVFNRVYYIHDDIQSVHVGIDLMSDIFVPVVNFVNRSGTGISFNKKTWAVFISHFIDLIGEHLTENRNLNFTESYDDIIINFKSENEYGIVEIDQKSDDKLKSRTSPFTIPDYVFKNLKKQICEIDKFYNSVKILAVALNQHYGIVVHQVVRLCRSKQTSDTLSPGFIKEIIQIYHSDIIENLKKDSLYKEIENYIPTLTNILLKSHSDFTVRKAILYPNK